MLCVNIDIATADVLACIRLLYSCKRKMISPCTITTHNKIRLIYSIMEVHHFEYPDVYTVPGRRIPSLDVVDIIKPLQANL